MEIYECMKVEKNIEKWLSSVSQTIYFISFNKLSWDLIIWHKQK